MFESVVGLLPRPFVVFGSPSPRSSWSEVIGYRPLFEIGSGAFGDVFCAVSRDGQKVAIKRTRMDGDESRELSILQMIDSEHCIRLLDYVAVPNESLLYLVTDIFPMSLKDFLDDRHSFSRKIDPMLMKRWIFQMFSGLEHCHSLHIAHRDMKTSNILVDPESQRLVICDMGSAKVMAPNVSSSSVIGSRYYRAPELLLGCKYYSYAVDIWSAGCIICEMLLDSLPMFAGESNAGQLVQILQIIGMPSREDACSFDHSIPFPEVEQICSLKNCLPSGTDKDLLDLLSAIFVYNPSKRPSASECLMSPYFDDFRNE
jgi:serine/threonine protein kinase